MGTIGHLWAIQMIRTAVFPKLLHLSPFDGLSTRRFKGVGLVIRSTDQLPTPMVFAGPQRTHCET